MREREGRDEDRNRRDTHHRCSAFSIGSCVWNPSCPSLAVTRTTTTTAAAAFSFFRALRLVLRRDDFSSVDRSSSSSSFLPFFLRTLTTLGEPRSSSRGESSRAHGSRTTSSVASRGSPSLARRSERVEKGERGGLKGTYDHSARSFVRSVCRVATCVCGVYHGANLVLPLSLSRKGKSLVTRTILICNPRRSNGDRTLRIPPHPTSPLPPKLHHPLRSVLPLSLYHFFPSRSSYPSAIVSHRAAEPIGCSSRLRFAAPSVPEARRPRALTARQEGEAGVSASKKCRCAA